MNKKSNRWVQFVVAMVLCLCILPIAAFAAQEVEYNGSIENAQSIYSNEFVYGNLADDSDQDYYAVYLDSPGYISLSFEHDYIDNDSTYWAVSLLNKDQETLAKYWISGTKVEDNRDPIGVPAGTYYIKVERDWKSSEEYRLKLNYTASSEWETEFNNEVEYADQLSTNEFIYGSLMNDSDQDYYTVYLDSPGYVSLSFEHDYIDNDSTYWAVSLLNKDQKTLAKYWMSGTKVEDTSDPIGVPAGTYYIKVEHDRKAAIAYGLKLNYTVSSEWETEFNNEIQYADQLSTNEFIYGSLMNDSDQDYYTVYLDSPGYVSLSFEHDYIDNDSTYWAVSLLNKDQKTLAKYWMSGTEVEDTRDPIGVPAGTYYIKVEHDRKAAIAYGLKLNYTVSSEWETEFNNEIQHADQLSTNELVYGSLMNDSDQDYYTVYLDSPGYISLSFVHDYIDNEHTYWAVSLLDKDQQLLSKYWFSGTKVEESRDPIGVPAGTYYIKVERDWEASVAYGLKLNYTVSSEWETEFNDEVQYADQLSTNEFICGSLMNDSDQDYYTVYLDSPGYISLSFEHDYVDNGHNYWAVSLLNKDQQLLSKYWFSGTKVEENCDPVGVPAGTYYIRVERDWEASVAYRLKLNYTVSSEWETEFNNEFRTANALETDKVIYGTLMNSDDEDYYKFHLNRADHVTLEFNHGYVDSGWRHWEMQLCNADKQEVGWYGIDGNDTEFASPGIDLPAGTYYLKISCDHHSAVKYGLAVLSESGVRFTDVRSSDYFYNPVQWAVKMGITRGIGNGKFGPEFICTRAQAVTFLWHAAGDPEPFGMNHFTDVKTSDYFCKAAIWAAENGITRGIGNNMFGPDFECTRAQIVTFLWKAKGSPDAIVRTDFSDVSINDYFYTAAQWAAENGITRGIGNDMFGPHFPCTRGQIVTFLHHAYSN